MLHALGDPAWIVDAADLTLADINRSALGLLALSEADLPAVAAMALIGTPEDVAFWNDVKAGHTGQLLKDRQELHPQPARRRERRPVLCMGSTTAVSLRAPRLPSGRMT